MNATTKGGKEMEKIWTLKHTIKSGSHNAAYNDEIGYHWPAGQQFKKLRPGRQEWHGKVGFEQVGGEEVILVIPATQVKDLF
jgi:hypothetical protein